MNSANQNIEQTVSHLLDRQSDLKKTLQKYNTKVAVFEEHRNNFFQKLIKTNKIDELKTVVPLFDTVFYVETERPELVPVNVTDVSKGLVNIEKEYDIISKEDITPKKLAAQTIERILSGMCVTSKDDIFQAVLKGKTTHTVFQLNNNGIILNEHKFTNINNNNNVEPIIDYATEIFELIKQHCLKENVQLKIGMKPTVCDSEKKIIYSWA